MTQKTYGLMAIGASLFAALGLVVQTLLTTAGYLTLHGANNMAIQYTTVDVEQAQALFELFQLYQKDYHPVFYQVTIGGLNNLAGFLAGVCMLVAVFFTVQYIRHKKHAA